MDDQTGAGGAGTGTVYKPKSIVLFSDGTGNSSAKLFKTNVFRLYEAVDLGPTQPNQQRQIAFYDDGVGTSTFRPLRMLQGIFGFGLKRNILEIYCYACRNYDPDSVPIHGSGVDDKGDHIYGFGFSRGAFTMRLVIGLIADQGLIPYTTDKDLEWKARAAWKQFRHKSPRTIERLLNLFGKESVEVPPDAETLRPARGKDRVEIDPGNAAARIYDPSENHRPVIRFVGVWDTVAAYGGPVTEITRAIDNFIYRLSMPNYELSPRIRSARHALALDDERDSFQPLLWDEFAEEALRNRYSREEAPWLHEDRLQQVWFTGMHADVGGGYPDESLSYVSLLWMLEGAHRCGLRTVDLIIDRYHGLANSYGPIHNSRAGMAGYYRYQPRRVETWLEDRPTRTLSLRDPAIRHPSTKKPKGLLKQVRVHASVIARIASGTDGYAPIVLPPAYEVVPAGGLVETKLLETTGGKPPLTAEESAAAKRNPPPLVAPRVLAWLTRDSKARVAADMETVWDFVWWRRLVYFLTVLATVALVALPWWVPPGIERVSDGSTGLWQLPIVDAFREAVGNLLRMVGEVLPGFVQRWVRSWAESPVWFVIFIIAILVSMYSGRRLERKIADRARAAWHSAIPRIPPATAGDEPGDLPTGKESWLAGSRNSLAYQRGLQLFKWLFLPNLVFAPVMLAAILWFGHAVAVQFALPFIEAGAFCRGNGNAPQISESQSDFSTKRNCNRTHGSVTAGKTYTISFEVVEPWMDSRYKATPAGLAAGDMQWGIGYLAAPFRRAIGSGYLQPLAAIRTSGDRDGFRFVQIRSLTMAPVEGLPNRYQAEFEAPATGELFLFANEAILLFDIDRLYENNEGTARVTIMSAEHAAEVARREADAAAAAEAEAAARAAAGAAAATAN